MTMEEQFRGLIDKINRKIEGDEKIREEVKDLKKTVNIDLGEEKYSFKFEDQKASDFKCELIDGADVTLTSTPEYIQQLLDGDLRPMRAFVTKKVKVEGKVQDLMFLKKFF